MKVPILCNMCGVNPGEEMHKCGNQSIYRHHEMCNCCHECREACWQEYVEMIESGEADQEVIDFYKGDN